jgi:7-cyano-7-deazaguanine synthase
MPARAIVLLSGGLDSTTTLAYALDRGYDVHAMTFRYGQRHAHEVDAAREIARQFGVREHIVVDIDLRPFGGSALTSDLPVPKDRATDEMRGGGIPITYVPARNTIFLSFALAWAEVREAHDIFIGVNALDYSGYPDCRPEYIAAFEQMANLATRRGVEGNAIVIHAPLIDLTKGQIIELGHTLGVDYALTTSCYDPDSDGHACGRCDACRLRLKGFEEAGVDDPARYAV